MKEIVYQPHRDTVAISIVLLAGGIMMFVLLPLALSQFGLHLFFMLFVGVGSFLCGLAIYRDSRSTLIVDEDKIRIIESRLRGCRYIDWEEIKYTYYVHNHMGGVTVLLSARELSLKQAKRLSTKRDYSILSVKLYDNGVIVFPDNCCEETSAIREIAESKTSVISYLNR